MKELSFNWRFGNYALEDYPAADIAPVKRGKWEEVEVEIAEDMECFPDLVTMRCGACKRYHTTVYFYGSGTDMMHFCPNCGAKMEVAK